MPLKLNNTQHHHTAGDIYTNNNATLGGALNLQVLASVYPFPPSNFTFLSDGKIKFGNVDPLQFGQDVIIA